MGELKETSVLIPCVLCVHRFVYMVLLLNGFLALGHHEKSMKVTNIV